MASNTYQFPVEELVNPPQAVELPTTENIELPDEEQFIQRSSRGFGKQF